MAVSEYNVYNRIFGRRDISAFTGTSSEEYDVCTRFSLVRPPLIPCMFLTEMNNSHMPKAMAHYVVWIGN